MKKVLIINRWDASGFTLIELMVAIGVAAILLAIAVPSFQTIFNSNRVVTVTNDYITALNYARSQAVKGGAITTLCMSNNGSNCTGSSGWSNGWIVWSDLNSNGVMDTGELMQSHGPINAGDVAMGGTQSSFSFNGLGALTTTTGGDRFNICTPSELSISNTVTVDPSGHLRNVVNPTLTTCP